MKWSYLALLAAAPLSCHAATYYLDHEHGLDSNFGTAATAPWQTLEKLNGAKFQPGDRILLKSGSARQGQLAPSSSGAEGAAIVIDRYGGGARPRIEGGGQVEDAVRLYNVQ